MPSNKTSDQGASSPEEQLAALVARLDPKYQKIVTSVQKIIRKRFPTLNELVYDYSRNLVISYSPNEAGGDALVAISAEATGVRFVFNYGVDLPDPKKILLGNANQIRYIQLESAGDLSKPEVEAVMTAAVKRFKFPLTGPEKGRLVIKPSKTGSKSAKTKTGRSA